MAKKYEGGWGIRVRKNVVVGPCVWLDNNGELTTADKADKFETRDEAYDELDNVVDVQIDIGDRLIDACDFAVAKLPDEPNNTTGYSVPVNPNPDRPWDVIFDRVPPCQYTGDEDYLANTAPPVAKGTIPGFFYKKINPKSKEGKTILDAISKIFGIKFNK